MISSACALEDFRRLHPMTSGKTKEDLEREKRLAAETVARWIPDGARIGIGSGTTSAYFIRALGTRVREEGLRVSGIPTSIASEELARSVGIPLLEPASGLRLDFTVDGADEVTPELHLIKGGGGKLFREKVIATASRFLLVIADSSKPVRVLGAMPLPVEIVPFSAPWVADQIAALGGAPIRREHEGVPVKTDQGNWLLDCHFRVIPDPLALDLELKKIPGVLENGLFLGLAKLAVVADGDTAMLLRPGAVPDPLTQFDVLPPIV
jgi:ribose 5-phosphate isomerase A